MSPPLTITDRIYGTFTLASPTIIALLGTPTLQRLKGIGQYGMPDEFYHLPGFSRFEHSVGVMLLLLKLGASEAEQIAGLLHDVSHTAFSHTVDWVVSDGRTENFQDEQHERIIANSELPEILEQYGYTATQMSDYHNFTLLEQPLPGLCADRVDYALREFPAPIVERCLIGITTRRGKIVFHDKTTALLFAEHFLERQTSHWGGFESISRWYLFAKVLRQALDEKIITFDDFWKDDDWVMTKIYRSKNPTLERVLQILKNKSLRHFPLSNEVRYKKFRFVDPEFVEKEKLLHLSDVDEEFRKKIEVAREENNHGKPIVLV